MRNLKINLDVNEIIRLYTEESKTIQDICIIMGVNYGTIKLRLINSGIKLRSNSESKKIVMNREDVKQRVIEGCIRSQPKRKETNLLKYGNEVPACGINWKDDYEKEYGVRHPNQREEIKEKMKGDKNPAKIPECRQKIKENRWKNKTEEELKQIKENQKTTWLENLGVDNPLKSKDIQNTIRENCMNKRGVDWITKDPKVINKILTTKFTQSSPEIIRRLKELNLELVKDFIGVTKTVPIKCKICDNQFESTIDYIFNGYGICRVCHPYQSSIGEGELKDFIKILLPETNIIFNDRKILKGFELDILIHEKNIAIEFDGIFTHSEKRGVTKEYHLKKTEECINNNIQLIHIFEDEWHYKKDIVKSILKDLLNINDSIKISSDLCEIKEIESKIKNIFLNQYYIQGVDISAISLGAFYNNELVSVMTFSNEETIGIYELNCFCSNPSYHIPGIASKLLSHFKNNYQWKEIFSYCDRRWSNGNTYYKLGFTLDRITKPNYWYVKGMNRIHRFNLRKREDEPKDISEKELRFNEGYSRVWDCGNYKFTLYNTSLLYI